MDELNLTGNSLKSSRPILSFDSHFDAPHWALVKEMFVQTFGTPTDSRKIKPFIDRVMTFTIRDEKVWVRNYQIIDGEVVSLSEIGPRFVLQLVRIFDLSMSGSTLYENTTYVTPNNLRRVAVGKKVVKHLKRAEQKLERGKKLARNVIPKDELAQVFE